MKPSEIEVKTNNLKAHFTIVKEDLDKQVARLSDANEELTRTKKVLDETKKVLDSLDAEIAKKRPYLDEISDKLRKKEKELEARELAVSEQESEKASKMLQDERNILERTRIAKDDLNLATVNFERLKGILEEEERLLEERISSRKAELVKRQKDLTDLDDKYSDKEREILALDEQIDAKRGLLDIVRQDIRDELRAKETILKNLTDRENAVIIREKDARVIVERLRKAYKKIYPDLKLNI